MSDQERDSEVDDARAGSVVHTRGSFAGSCGEEIVSRKKIEYKGTIFEEMDVDAILARRPQVALIDEFAHTNVEGTRHRKRYEDVLELLDAKIDVLSTMNIQHLESMNPTVQSITGIQVRETVPDWVLHRADEIVMADLTPEGARIARAGPAIGSNAPGASPRI